MGLEKLMNPEALMGQETVEDKIADMLLRKLEARLEKVGGDGQMAMRIVLMMAESINESIDDGEEEIEG